MSRIPRVLIPVLLVAAIAATAWRMLPAGGENRGIEADRSTPRAPSPVQSQSPTERAEELTGRGAGLIPQGSPETEATKAPGGLTVEQAHEAAAALLARPQDLSDPGNRERLVAQMKELDRLREEAVFQRAAELGLAVSGIREDGTEFVLRDFEGDLPVYEISENLRAAITTATDQVRGTSPFNVDGSGELIGMWEVNQPRATHQEFGVPSRLSFGELGSGTSNHATHVAGTLIAAGVNSSLKGMAPGARILSYNSRGDLTEMVAVGAAFAGEAGRIGISNHSYGFERGWEGNDWRGSFSNDSLASNDFEDDFGRYSYYSSQIDGLTYNLPYYLPFFAAGNHGNDDAPDPGQLWSHGRDTYYYNPAVHPAGDDDYKNGFDQCEGKKLGKNVMVVGAIGDAVSGSTRRLELADLTSFSSAGPADDGRIKPDIVANGRALLSTGGEGDTDEFTSSGTSMSSPNAAGSAALLMDYYGTRFPGQAMRAATLKGLMIHTADDLGNPGPDYRYGWGLMNTRAAAELIKSHAEEGSGKLIEERMVADGEVFQWDGVASAGKAVRVTLCWTDPPAGSISGHENRTKALVNDLDLSIQGPDGTLLPFVMPHVGDWSISSLSAPAVTGVNTVDNVEQVVLPNPVEGQYTVNVSYSGSLAQGLQDFSLIISGLDEQAPEPGIGSSALFFEDFEDELEEYWQITSTSGGRVERTGNHGVHRGAGHLTMDSNSITYSRNELTLTLDLAGAENLELSFWAKEFGDELDLPPESPFTGSADFDGVAISEDGIDWYVVLSFPLKFSAYTQFSIDLDAAVREAGLRYGDGFQIRFSQFDNASIAADGIAIDDIRVVARSLPEIEIEDSGGDPLMAGSRMVDMGGVPIGSGGSETTVTIRNTGAGHLEDLAFSLDGEHAYDFSLSPSGLTSIPPGETTDIKVSFSPGAVGERAAILHVVSNDAEEPSIDVYLTGIGLHTLESWRLEHFQTTADFGHAADAADPNGDGITNLMAFALGLDPLVSGAVPLTLEVDGNELLVNYQRSRAAVEEGVVFKIEWSDTLNGKWSSDGVVERRVSDEGLLQQVESTLSRGEGRRFVRLNMTLP